MNAPKYLESWGAGDLYESYMGRWSRKLAQQFLTWIDVPTGANWLDVGCGTGALVETILNQCDPQTVVGMDRSPGFVAHAQNSIEDQRVRLEVGDVVSLPFETDRYDSSISGLVLNFVSDPAAMVSEMARVTNTTGVVAVYVWDYAGGNEMMRHFWDAATQLDSGSSKLDQRERFPLCQPEPLRELFVQSGLGGVEIRSIEIDTPFRDFDDYWIQFSRRAGRCSNLRDVSRRTRPQQTSRCHTRPPTDP